MRKHVLMGSVAIVALALSMPVAKAAAFTENVFTGLIPDLFAGLDIVSRELVGFIPSVDRDTSAERAAVGQAVKFHQAPIPAAVDITPAMVIPEPAGQTVGYDSIAITKSRAVPFGILGEDARGLNTGPGYRNVQADMFAQALRVLVNECEADLAATAAAGASRATGTAGTTPFATNVGDTAQLRKILDDNGAPPSERSLVGNTSMGAALRTLGQLTKANEVGDAMVVRDGTLIELAGFMIKESGQAISHTAGTSASATTNNAGYAVGATVITLASAGTGTILAGDVITFAGDANKYLVVSGDADNSNGGTITLAAPGLRVAMSAATKAITMIATYSANVGFHRGAIGLVFRQPALPPDGDAAIDRATITDERSGLVFEVAAYAGYRKMRYEVAAAWGTKAIKPAHIALLLG
jgi:hypothetical protein